ncbi:odorant receptor 131-2-like [Engraulis encrasicolus]|uniref:odorant receptor 131-2-like n=1 Tax=Engraulis encrasicolus TaxID=184585 RepID=UPI002FD44EA5
MVENASQIRLNITNQPILLVHRLLSARVLFVQVLVAIFLYVNSLMIVTFLKKEAFRTDTRYILFAQTLVLDSLLMVLTDFALAVSYIQYPMPLILCLVYCMVMIWCKTGTPLTLVAMCLERYVAICMPLRHADISTARRRLVGLVVIWLISAVPAFVLLFLYLARLSLFTKDTITVCSIDNVVVEKYNVHLAVLKFYFVCMSITIIFTYYKIVKAAKAVASNSKKSTSKGQKTVILHAMQLLLCLIHFLGPFIESAVMKVSFRMFIDLRYFNFVVFLIAPRCLSPLVYGLRDEKFSSVLKYYAMCGLNNRAHRRVHLTSKKA